MVRARAALDRDDTDREARSKRAKVMEQHVVPREQKQTSTDEGKELKKYPLNQILQGPTTSPGNTDSEHRSCATGGLLRPW